MNSEQEIWDFLHRHLHSVFTRDVDTYMATTDRGLSLYEWFVAPHRQDGLDFHFFMIEHALTCWCHACNFTATRPSSAILLCSQWQRPMVSAIRFIMRAASSSGATASGRWFTFTSHRRGVPRANSPAPPVTEELHPRQHCALQVESNTNRAKPLQ